MKIVLQPFGTIKAVQKFSTAKQVDISSQLASKSCCSHSTPIKTVQQFIHMQDSGGGVLYDDAIHNFGSHERILF